MKYILVLCMLFSVGAVAGPTSVDSPNAKAAAARCDAAHCWEVQRAEAVWAKSDCIAPKCHTYPVACIISQARHGWKLRVCRVFEGAKVEPVIRGSDIKTNNK